jgi:ATP-dependent Clp protease ATP-binding subunit ClpC
LRRAIQRYLEDPISEKILWKEYEAGDTILVDVGKNDVGEEEIVFKKAERAPDEIPVELAGAGVGDGDGEGTPE